MTETQAVERLFSAIDAFLADEDALFERLYAEGKDPAAYGFPFPRVVEIRSALAQARSSEGAEPDRYERFLTNEAAKLSPQPQGGGEPEWKPGKQRQLNRHIAWGAAARAHAREMLSDDPMVRAAGEGWWRQTLDEPKVVLSSAAPKAPVEGEEDLMAAFGDLPHKLVGIAQHLDIERGPDWQGRRETLLTAAGEMTRLEGVLKSPIAVRLNILRGSIAEPALSTPSPRVSVEEIARIIEEGVWAKQEVVDGVSCVIYEGIDEAAHAILARLSAQEGAE